MDLFTCLFFDSCWVWSCLETQPCGFFPPLPPSWRGFWAERVWMRRDKQSSEINRGRAWGSQLSVWGQELECQSPGWRGAQIPGGDTLTQCTELSKHATVTTLKAELHDNHNPNAGNGDCCKQMWSYAVWKITHPVNWPACSSCLRLHLGRLSHSLLMKQRKEAQRKSETKLSIMCFSLMLTKC